MRFLTLSKVRRWIKRLMQAILIAALCNDNAIEMFLEYTQWRLYNYGSITQTQQSKSRLQQKSKNPLAKKCFPKTMEEDNDFGLQLPLSDNDKTSKSRRNMET